MFYVLCLVVFYKKKPTVFNRMRFEIYDQNFWLNLNPKFSQNMFHAHANRETFGRQGFHNNASVFATLGF